MIFFQSFRSNNFSTAFILKLRVILVEEKHFRMSGSSSYEGDSELSTLAPSKINLDTSDCVSSDSDASSDSSSQKSTEEVEMGKTNDILTLFDANTKSKINRLLNMPRINRNDVWICDKINFDDSKFNTLRKRNHVRKTRCVHSDGSLTSDCLKAKPVTRSQKKLASKKGKKAKKPSLITKKSSSFFHLGKQETPESKDVMMPNHGFDKFTS